MLTEARSEYDIDGKSLYYSFEVPSIRSFLSFGMMPTARLLRHGDISLIKLERILNRPQNGNEFHGKLYPPLRPTEYIRTDIGETPVYIFDDHNHALFGWVEAYKEGRIAKGSTLLHFDDHEDSNLPIEFSTRISGLIPPLDKWSLQEAADYVRQSLRVTDFIAPAVYLRLVNTIYWIKFNDPSPKNGEFIHFTIPCYKVGSNFLAKAVLPQQIKPELTIVDIDLDYFANVDGEEEEAEIEIVRRAISQAGVVTVAMSPDWIPAQVSMRILRKILKSEPAGS